MKNNTAQKDIVQCIRCISSLHGMQYSEEFIKPSTKRDEEMEKRKTKMEKLQNRSKCMTNGD